jgi:hypothetical protein
MEETLIAQLRTICPRVFSPTAPFGTQRPYVTWQHFGGRPLRSSEGRRLASASLVDVSVWADTKADAMRLIRRIEDALCSSDLNATPAGEAEDADQPDGETFGAVQSFEVWI